MTTLLIIIYLTFISLGLPDSLLGSAWPAIQPYFGAPVSLAGPLGMASVGCTVVSGLMSTRLIARFGTKKVVIVSVAMTALGLFGYAISPSVYLFFLFAIPLGLGAGCIDTALNNFVANHYEARHMSWLHCFWGIGATAGPMILSLTLMLKNGWRLGYTTIGCLQTVLLLVLIVTMPLWDRAEKKETDGETPEEPKRLVTNREALRLPLIGYAMVCFLFYCTLETTANLWGSTFLVSERGMSPDVAARVISCYFIGIAVGRFLSGVVARRFDSPTLIRFGLLFCLVGTVLLFIPHAVPAVIGILLLGLGSAPIFPCMIHETPHRFGTVPSQAAMALQMSFAYTGSMTLPPLFGLVAESVGLWLFPVFLLICIGGMLFCSEILQRNIDRRDRLESEKKEA